MVVVAAHVSDQEDVHDLFSHARTVRTYFLILSGVLLIVALSGVASRWEVIAVQLAIWPVRIAALAVLCMALVPAGYYAVELPWLSRHERVFTKEGLNWKRPWSPVVLVSRRPVAAEGRFDVRSGCGTAVQFTYKIWFRASPFIRDAEGRNRFLQNAYYDTRLRRLHERLRRLLEVTVSFACRHLDVDDLADCRDSLKLLAACELQLPHAPHLNPALVPRPVPDDQLLTFYRSPQAVAARRVFSHDPLSAIDPPDPAELSTHECLYGIVIVRVDLDVHWIRPA